MLTLSLFKTLWGHQGTLGEAIDDAIRAGFQGIEGQAPTQQKDQDSFKQQLNDSGLKYIAEITTAGTYVPDRQASPLEHLDTFKRSLDSSMRLEPLFITTLAGCDAWDEEQSVELFSQIMELAVSANIQVSFETHRSRSFFNPWTTARICRQLPDLNLTFDFSHWCVVCERLMDTEIDIIEELAPRALHIHARVGYDQGPQVPDPRHTRYSHELQRHQAWWKLLWLAMVKRGMTSLTMTPEFGPDGYQAIDVNTDKPVGDLWEMNQWMGHQQMQLFKSVKA
ncbi:MAG: sugar phosphate isomerase/epimerase [Gammaproteobacteria bacterium]|nr:sugar phosphate isomerase/epimerase [Gammaproteobacteria bacterium]